MYAVVLVGGFGTRLRPLTLETPKPMLPVGHRPMIVDLVDRLAAAGVSDVVLALGFNPEPFQLAFPDGSHGDVRVHYAVEPEPLDTAGAIGFAARAAGVGGTFLVANGDIIAELDFGELVDAHRRANVAATLHLHAVDDPSAFGVVESRADGIVERFVEKPAPGETTSNLINAGSYVFEPEVLDMIPHDRPWSVERDVFPTLTAAGRLAGYATDDYWLDTGRPEQYLRANLDLISGERTRTVLPVHPAALVDASAEVSDAVVAAGATIGAGARVTRSFVMPGATVAPGATVERSIVAGTVGEGARVADAVIGAGYGVAPGAEVVAQRLPDPE